MRPLAAVLASSLVLLSSLAAQDGAIDPKSLQPFADLYDVRWSVDEHGQTWMTPSPSAGTTDAKELLFSGIGGAGPFPFLGMAATNGGPAVWAMVVHPGPTDLLSLTDAAEHFRRLGLATGEADLQQRIAGRPTSEVPALRHREELDRILAVRLAGIERMINMAPLLQSLAKDDRESLFLRRAAAEVAADLAGEPVPPRPELPPLADILKRMPVGTMSIQVIQFDAMQPLGDLLSTLRRNALEATRRKIVAAGGKLLPASAAGSMKIAGIASAVPYEFARVFGNQDPRRLVIGGRPGSPVQAYCVADGRFSPAALHTAMAANTEVELTFENGVLAFEQDGDAVTRVRTTETRIEVSIGGFDELGEAASEITARPAPGAAHWYWLRDIEERGLDELGLDMPLLAGLHGAVTVNLLDGETLVDVRATYASEGEARAAKNGILALPGMAALAVSPGARELFNELLRGFKVEQDGSSVRVVLTSEMGFVELVKEAMSLELEAR